MLCTFKNSDFIFLGSREAGLIQVLYLPRWLHVIYRQDIFSDVKDLGSWHVLRLPLGQYPLHSLHSSLIMIPQFLQCTQLPSPCRTSVCTAQGSFLLDSLPSTQLTPHTSGLGHSWLLRGGSPDRPSSRRPPYYFLCLRLLFTSFGIFMEITIQQCLFTIYNNHSSQNVSLPEQWLCLSYSTLASLEQHLEC